MINNSNYIYIYYNFKLLLSFLKQPSHPFGKTESTIHLVNAEVTLGAKNLTSRKHVLLVCIDCGTNILLLYSSKKKHIELFLKTYIILI